MTNRTPLLRALLSILAPAVLAAGAFALQASAAAPPTDEKQAAKPAAAKPAVAKPTAAKPAAAKPAAAKPAVAKPAVAKPAAAKTAATPKTATAPEAKGPAKKPADKAAAAKKSEPKSAAKVVRKDAKHKDAKHKDAKHNAKSTAGKPAAVKHTALASAVPGTIVHVVPPPDVSPEEIGRVRDAFGLIRRGRIGEATELEKTMQDAAARKLVEWMILRQDDNGIDFDRYATFIRYNPSWPSLSLLRKRAESALWRERRNNSTVRAFFQDAKPASAKGRFALGRIMAMQGDRAGGEAQVREGWRTEAFPEEVETQVLEEFPNVLTRADHKARMHRRLYAKDFTAALRTARRLGDAEVDIVKAYAAVIGKSDKAGGLLDAVPAEARQDAAFMLARVQWLMQKDRVADAGRVALAAPHEAAQVHDADEWWRVRRMLARKLLDAGDVETAYKVARDAAVPAGENYRADHYFMAGWIALRFLHDPATALAYFARIPHGITNPIALARAGYWQGRAAEALGRNQEARAHYEAAARHPTAYYGQLARARLGIAEMALRRPPEPDAAARAGMANNEVVRATEILYAIGERDLVIPVVADLAERGVDVATLLGLAELTAKREDARAMLLLGKAALGRGFAFDHYAFPNVGVPHYTPVAPDIERSMAYAIVRQESEFNQRDVSPANAVGLMQVTPEAGRDTAKRFGVAYDWKRMVNDAVYNSQMGAAELAGLMQDYRGSYILTFAGYNAGRGRVREWIGRFGDPRDPKVDPIDWVERIPISETRNYVQRVMENLQIYRVRFGASSRLTIEADIRRGAVGN
ncbi:MAG TPA: transglycosylase SLT domain-containing protein [Xanthobacteraceae bacterium]|nr:transglycosylase SLT domain-containing protein [Xanthobacteraceae bacterium]